jgi:hypothetical protein
MPQIHLRYSLFYFCNVFKIVRHDNGGGGGDGGNEEEDDDKNKGIFSARKKQHDTGWIRLVFPENNLL